MHWAVIGFGRVAVAGGRVEGSLHSQALEAGRGDLSVGRSGIPDWRPAGRNIAERVRAGGRLEVIVPVFKLLVLSHR